MRFKVIVSFTVVVFIMAVLGLMVHGQEFIKAGGCTTILVGKNATADGSVIMGHNEDMGSLSGRLLFQPVQTHDEKEIALNYVNVPQVPKTYQYWVSGNSKPVAEKHFDGGWLLCGMNQFGISLSCNTMSTREKRIPKGKGMMRYAIRQLILERSKTAREAVILVGKLIDTYGQSDSPVAYCITDRTEAWVVETTYRHWVARRISDNDFHVEANQYTIKTQWDLASENLVKYATAQGWYRSSNGPFNFKYIYGDPAKLDHPRNMSREYQGNSMLEHRVGSITVKDILSVLSQPPVQTSGTQAFMVWQLRRHMPLEIGCVMWHGMSGANTSLAVPIYIGSTRVPKEYTTASYDYEPVSAWWQFERLQRLVYPRVWEYSDVYLDVRRKLDRFQETIFKESLVVEEKAIKVWKQGDIKRGKELLTNHTYKMLKDALKETRHLNGSAKHAKHRKDNR